VDQADLADTPPMQFIAGVAGDLQIPDERAVSLATNWVAGHCRSRIVEVRKWILQHCRCCRTDVPRAAMHCY